MILILILNFNQFQQNSAPPEKISTKLFKVNPFPYRNSEFHTIHDLEIVKLNSILFQVFHRKLDFINLYSFESIIIQNELSKEWRKDCQKLDRGQSYIFLHFNGATELEI